eukprot:1160650-Pelagomonas_calceolata.AAC.7
MPALFSQGENALAFEQQKAMTVSTCLDCLQQVTHGHVTGAPASEWPSCTTACFIPAQGLSAKFFVLFALNVDLPPILHPPSLHEVTAQL